MSQKLDDAVSVESVSARELGAGLGAKLTAVADRAKFVCVVIMSTYGGHFHGLTYRHLFLFFFFNWR